MKGGKAVNINSKHNKQRKSIWKQSHGMAQKWRK